MYSSSRAASLLFLLLPQSLFILLRCLRAHVQFQGERTSSVTAQIICLIISLFHIINVLQRRLKCTTRFQNPELPQAGFVRLFAWIVEVKNPMRPIINAGQGCHAYQASCSSAELPLSR